MFEVLLNSLLENNGYFVRIAKGNQYVDFTLDDALKIKTDLEKLVETIKEKKEKEKEKKKLQLQEEITRLQKQLNSL